MEPRSGLCGHVLGVVVQGRAQWELWERTVQFGEEIERHGSASPRPAHLEKQLGGEPEGGTSGQAPKVVERRRLRRRRRQEKDRQGAPVDVSGLPELGDGRPEAALPLLPLGQSFWLDADFLRCLIRRKPRRLAGPPQERWLDDFGDPLSGHRIG